MLSFISAGRQHVLTAFTGFVNYFTSEDSVGALKDFLRLWGKEESEGAKIST